MFKNKLFKGIFRYVSVFRQSPLENGIFWKGMANLNKQNIFDQISK